MSSEATKTLDCLVLARDKVVRAMLATCARSMGLSAHASGSARTAGQALQKGGYRYRIALVGPDLEDADAATVASRLAAHAGVGKVLGFGLTPPEAPEGPGFEPREFPVDFVELFLELRQVRPDARPAEELEAAAA